MMAKKAYTVQSGWKELLTGYVTHHMSDARLQARLQGEGNARHLRQGQWLLDTRYKTPSSPSAGDVEQGIAYAKALGCPEAVLVYPQELPKPLGHVVGRDIHVWTPTFAQRASFLRVLVVLFAQGKRLTKQTGYSSVAYRHFGTRRLNTGGTSARS